MTRHVFVLGAGASCEAGAPLMKNFLDRAEDLLKTSPVSIDTASFQAVFSAVSMLQSVHAKCVFDTQNLESVFGAFEMASLSGRLGSLNRQAARNLPKAMTRLIVDTIEHNMRFPIHNSGIVAPPGYQVLANVINEHLYGEGVSILTFNYDIGMEVALTRCNIHQDYALDFDIESTRALNPRTMHVLKLHGALNWTTTTDGAVAPIPVKHFLSEDRHILPEHTSTTINVREKLAKYGGAAATGESFIVPPSWSKLGHYERIAPVWTCAAQQLADAQNVFILGFSLPESDAFFRLLYGLGSISRTRIRNFWVFDPDERVKTRFQNLLGPDAIARFKFVNVKFSQAAQQLASMLGQDSAP